MNFFGHTVLAVRRGGDPSFVLGAMLPDFATMIRARPPRPEHTGIGSGMQFHWRTDEVFHRSAAFLALTHQAVAWLSARGVRSGSALAAAHIGVEVLLDAARAIVGAIETLVAEGKTLTRDLGGKASTTEVGQALASLI